MADNITVTPGTGATVAAENLGGALVQRVKLAIGVVDTDNGDVSASNPIPAVISAGSAAIGSVTVSNFPATQPVSAVSLPLPTGAATSANQTTEISSLASIVTNTASLTLAQGSTTSGQTGTLDMAAVTTASPSYTTAQTSPLSLTPTGDLRAADDIDVSISSGAITVSTSAVAARVGGANLANRKMLQISPINNTVYIGATSGVTTTTGIPIYPGQVVSYAFTANVTPYLISGSSGSVVIFEGA